MSGEPWLILPEWDRVPPAGPIGTPPSGSDTFLIVAAMMAAHALDDLDALAAVVEGLEVEELRAALRVATGMACRELQRRPGGLALWQRVWRESDTLKGDA